MTRAGLLTFALTAALLTAACAATDASRAPDTTAGPQPSDPATTRPGSTGSTRVPGTTRPGTLVVIPPSTATTTTIPPAGTPIPGGPVRPTHTPEPAPPGPCTDAAGRVEHLTFQSNVLAINQPTQRYRVYTPACYRWNTTTAYPVLYLMHGAQTDESQWDDVGIFQTADRLIGSGAIPPMIVVLADGIWAMGSYEYEPPLMERLLLGELEPAIEQDFRTIPDRAHRAVGGISRGGEWALLIGGRHPEVFGAVGGHSPAAGPPGSPTSLLVGLFAGNTGQAVWLDVGAADALTGPVTALHQALDAAGIPNELHTAAGGHERAYWASMSEAYLRFYARLWAPATVPGLPPGATR